MGGEVSHHAGEYSPPELPENNHEVRVSVYKLEITGIGIIDRMSAGVVGAYHTGVVVGSEEWAFGGHDVAGKSGVYRTKPELNPDYIFYRREVLGNVHGDSKGIGQQIRQMARTEKWGGPCYDLIERNCNHFSSDLVWMLLKKRPPEWINGTAENMALTRRRKSAEQKTLHAALTDYYDEFAPQAHREAASASSPTVCLAFQSGDKRSQHEQWFQQMMVAQGAQAFSEAFASTFEKSWISGRQIIGAAGKTCSAGEDPDAVRAAEESIQLAAASAAAIAAAKAVGCAARAGIEARASQVGGAAQVAWDQAWARGTAQMLRSWREQAVAGTLDPDPAGPQGLERSQLVAQTLAAAETEAEVALEKEERLSARRAELERRVAEAVR